MKMKNSIKYKSKQSQILQERISQVERMKIQYDLKEVELK